MIKKLLSRGVVAFRLLATATPSIPGDCSGGGFTVICDAGDCACCYSAEGSTWCGSISPEMASYICAQVVLQQ